MLVTVPCGRTGLRWLLTANVEVGAYDLVCCAGTRVNGWRAETVAGTSRTLTLDTMRLLATVPLDWDRAPRRNLCADAGAVLAWPQGRRVAPNQWLDQ
jgi:hypothetical protein